MKKHLKILRNTDRRNKRTVYNDMWSDAYSQIEVRPFN